MELPDINPLLQHAKRIAIVGGPKTGKTTLAGTVQDRPVVGTDKYIGLPWSEIPDAVIRDPLLSGDAWVLEGAQAARCLRRGLEVDAVIWLSTVHEATGQHQAAMVKSVTTIMNEYLATRPNIALLRL